MNEVLNRIPNIKHTGSGMFFLMARTLRRRGRGYVENRGRNSLPDHRAAAYSLYIQSVVPQGEPFAARLVQRDRR